MGGGIRQRPEAQLTQVETVVLTDENLTTLMEIIAFGLKSIAFSTTPVGNKFDQFEIQGRPSAVAPYHTLYALTADYTPTPAGILIGAYGEGAGADDLTNLADGANGGFLLYPQGYNAIRVQVARASGSNATVNAWAGFELPI